MKAYTDLDQSRKLTEILQLESADMSYTLDFDTLTYESVTRPYKVWIVPKGAETYKGFEQVVPCWSLAALINILTSNCNKQTIDITRGGWLNDGKEFTKNFFISYEDSEDNDFTLNNKELIDTCVDMIEVLHEQKLL